MRKVLMFNMVSVDGFFEAPDHDITWHTVDDDFNEFAVRQLNAADGLLFGRVTYDLMAGYWPTPQAITDDPEIARLMNETPKVVFSKTLAVADWHNTRLVKDDAAAEVTRLKQQPGRDLLLFGSGELARTLIQESLIDEFRLMISPVVLGRGTPLFKDVNERINLRLVHSKTFGNGNVLLYYAAGTAE